MRGWFTFLLLLALAPAARAGDVTASPPHSLSVTIYRAPYRGGGAITLDRLGGFALVTETRTVRLPAGESRLRFEGVVDGIQPSSAIVTGLPGGVIEKDRDAALISPEALVRAALGAEVTLARTNPRTGKVTRIAATIRSANAEGVVFETADGVEALRCSGLPETFRFDRLPAGLVSTPTLSVLTRSARPITATVTLSYLASGFDWAANYVARLGPGGHTLNLVAWATLANGNGVGLPDAKVQIVAGRLNRAGGDPGLVGGGAHLIANCWPRGSTSDTPEPGNIALVHPYGFDVDQRRFAKVMVYARGGFATTVAEAVVMAPPAPPPPPEQLGDLKLYRVSQATTVAPRQSKQVRLIDQADVPFTRLASADLPAAGAQDWAPAPILLRTHNTLEGKLGLPLPSGRVAVFDTDLGCDQLLGEANLRDTAVDEDVELGLGASPDIQVRQRRLTYTAKSPEIAQLTPELALALLKGKIVEEVDITSARGAPTAFELRLRTYGNRHVASASQPMATKDGRPIFRLTVPANGAVTVRYVVEN